jgi:hypothetical protein
VGPKAVSASTIYVPADQPTIQSAITVAVNGDVVLVSPGTYLENIDFKGKAIVIRSTGGPKVTIIDGSQKGTVVSFISGESLTSQLDGFTLQNGMKSSAVFFDGGGIAIGNSSATITGNIIQNNAACGSGGGIAVYHGSPSIRNNVIRDNSQESSCFGGNGGAGISIVGSSGGLSGDIVGNVIASNVWRTGDGGGISVNGSGTLLIQNNTIAGNTAAGPGIGGGISVGNTSSPLIIQNLIYNNTANQGGGIYLLVPEGNTPLLVNNTIVNNNSIQLLGSAIYVSGFDSQSLLFNNLLIGEPGQNAVFCDPSFSAQPPTFTTNDAFSRNSTGLQGACASQSGQNGNISIDPMFAGDGSFRVTSGSLAIDAGTNSAPNLPKKDLAGKPRIVDGDDDGDQIVDMGAYEFH